MDFSGSGIGQGEVNYLLDSTVSFTLFFYRCWNVFTVAGISGMLIVFSVLKSEPPETDL